jgi:hypothetical protein
MLANLALVLDIICYTIWLFKGDTSGKIGGLPLLLRKRAVFCWNLYLGNAHYIPYPGGSGALASADERLAKIV